MSDRLAEIQQRVALIRNTAEERARENLFDGADAEMYQVGFMDACNDILSALSNPALNAVKGRVDAAEAEVQRLTHQQQERDRPRRDDGRRTYNADQLDGYRAALHDWGLDQTERDKRITRFEVIEIDRCDLSGRVFTAKMCQVELSYQDEGRTLKVFVKHTEASPSVDAVDPSAGTQERGPRAHEEAFQAAADRVFEKRTGAMKNLAGYGEDL